MLLICIDNKISNISEIGRIIYAMNATNLKIKIQIES